LGFAESSGAGDVPLLMQLPGKSVSEEIMSADIPGIVMDYIKSKYDLTGMINLFQALEKDSRGALLGGLIKEAIVESGNPKPFSNVRRRIDIARARLEGRDLVAEEMEKALLEK